MVAKRGHFLSKTIKNEIFLNLNLVVDVSTVFKSSLCIDSCGYGLCSNERAQAL